MPSYTPLTLGTHYNYPGYSGTDCVQLLIVRKKEIGWSYTGHGGWTTSPIDSTTPMAGAVGKWGYETSSTEGHVAFVEYLDSSGSPVFSSPSGTANAVWVATKSATDAEMAKHGWYFKGYWYTDAYPGSGPDPGPSPSPTTTYTAYAYCNVDSSLAYAKVARCDKDTWDWNNLDYQDSVSWESDGSDDNEHWLVWKAFNVGGNDEDGFPKVEFYR